MNDEPQHKHRKYYILALFAVFIAILGVILPEQENIAFEIVKNNTDLCQFNHTSSLCDGTRQSNVTYYTNNTPIVLYVFAHANVAAQTAGVFLYRDNILIEAQAGRPLAAPEQTWRGITAIIPKNSSYRVNFTDYHHFEWYEDQILSGRNGTLSINQTVIGGSGCIGNCSFNSLGMNMIYKNNTLDSYGIFINLISPLKTIFNDIESYIDPRLGSITIEVYNTTTSNFSSIDMTPEFLSLGSSNLNSTSIVIRHDFIKIQTSTGLELFFNGSYVDFGGANLINCGNCGGNQNLSQVLTVGNNGTFQNVVGLMNVSSNGTLVINRTWPLTNAGLTLLEVGRSSTPSKFRATLNDANGAFNFRVNVKDDITQDIPTGSGWSFAMLPGTHKFGVTTIYPGTTNAYNPFAIWSNASVYTQGRIQLGDPATTLKTQYEIQIQNLSAISGVGNYSIVMVDSDGILRAFPMNGTGNHYGCFKENGEPFPGTPGC